MALARHRRDVTVAPSVHDAERLLLGWAVVASDEASAAAFRRAARGLRGSGPGRHALDDEAAIAEMARVLSAGEATSVPAAARYVAAKLPGQQSLNAGARRLERKYRDRLAQNIKCRDDSEDSA